MKPAAALDRARKVFSRLPESAILLLGRFSLAGVFWMSAQTKVQGFAVNFVSGEWQLGWPQLSASAEALFADEYQLPLLSPWLAAVLAVWVEHLGAICLLLGLATRFAAFALLVVTGVIQMLVYPSAWPTHGVWACVLLLFMARGPGRVSLDAWLCGRLK